MAGDFLYFTTEIRDEIQEIMEWAAQQACEYFQQAHQDLAQNSKATKNLWKRFNKKFSEAKHERLEIRELAISAFTKTFKITIELLDSKTF